MKITKEYLDSIEGMAAEARRLAAPDLVTRGLFGHASTVLVLSETLSVLAGSLKATMVEYEQEQARAAQAASSATTAVPPDPTP